MHTVPPADISREIPSPARGRQLPAMRGRGATGEDAVSAVRNEGCAEVIGVDAAQEEAVTLRYSVPMSRPGIRSVRCWTQRSYWRMCCGS